MWRRTTTQQLANIRDGDWLGERCPECGSELQARKQRGRIEASCGCGYRENVKSYLTQTSMEDAICCSAAGDA